MILDPKKIGMLVQKNFDPQKIKAQNFLTLKKEGPKSLVKIGSVYSWYGQMSPGQMLHGLKSFSCDVRLS